MKDVESPVVEEKLTENSVKLWLKTKESRLLLPCIENSGRKSTEGGSKEDFFEVLDTKENILEVLATF